jgi:hypothetical protein
VCVCVWLCSLTGAGWGGCAVALVPESKAEAFMKAIEESFFSTRVCCRKIGDACWACDIHHGVCLIVVFANQPHGDISTVLFSSKPAGGAAVYIPK